MSQADVAALRVIEEKHPIKGPPILWPSHSFGGGNLIKNCPPVPTFIARFAERTDWLGPDPARCFDCPVDPAPAAEQ